MASRITSYGIRSIDDVGPSTARRLQPFFVQYYGSFWTVWGELRQVGSAAGPSISKIANDAAAENLSRMQVRPIFSEAMDAVLDDRWRSKRAHFCKA